MKLTKKFLPVAGAAAIAATGMVTPIAAQAEVSASANISNMYFWRGQDISDGAPAFSGSIDYSHESGMFAGIWTSSEGHTAGTETDFYVGYAGEAGDFGYSVSLVRYQYPEAEEESFDVSGCTVDAPGGAGATVSGCSVDKSITALKASDSSFEEYVIGLSYQDFSFTAYINTDSDEFDSYKYYSFDYSMGKIGLHAGITSQDTSEAEYNDFNVSYAVTDALAFTVSKATGDGVEDSKDDVIFVLSLDLPIGEMK